MFFLTPKPSFPDFLVFLTPVQGRRMRNTKNATIVNHHGNRKSLTVIVIYFGEGSEGVVFLGKNGDES